MKLPRKPATLLKRITEDLAVIRVRAAEDESLLRVMMRTLVAEGKREADTLCRRWNRVSVHMDELARMAHGPNYRERPPEVPTPRAYEARAAELYEAAAARR